MGEVVSKAADVLLPLAGDVLGLVEDPVTALLPGTEAIFSSVSKLLGSESPPSSSSGAADQHQAQQLAERLPSMAPGKKQSTMVRIIELLMDELERS